jgi:hypothetical protein
MDQVPSSDDGQLMLSEAFHVHAERPGESYTEGWADYLYEVDRFSQPFWTIAEEMTQLNDFCVLCLYAARSQRDRLVKELDRLRTGEGRFVTDLGDFTGEAILVLGEQEPAWQDTCEFLTSAMCLVMLLAFAERSLKAICETIAGPGGCGERKSSESKISACLQSIGAVCDTRLAEGGRGMEIIEQCRRTRNAFAHGDWDGVRDGTSNVDLRAAFGAISKLLFEIEEALWATVWSETGAA